MASPPLGLIAGEGALPRAFARSARARGRRVVAVAFRGFADPELAADVDDLIWLHVGELEALVRVLREAGAGEAVLGGRVPKQRLYDDPGSLHLDAAALGLLASLGDRRDHSILGALAGWLAGQGVDLRPQDEWAPDLRAGEGTLGAVAPTPAALADVAFGWPLARRVAELQIGQTVVVKERAVLAVEAIEGTDAAIRRGTALGGPGACVVKVTKPGQDRRFDLPTVGPDTLAVLAAGGASVLALEAGLTLLVEREQMLRRADAHGISVLGIAAGRPPEAGA